MSRAMTQVDPFQKKLLKLLPSEAVAAYLAAINVVPAESGIIIYWIIVGFIFIVTPFYLVKFMEMNFRTHLSQIVLIPISFLIWVFSINGELLIPVIVEYDFLKTLILVLWTFILPVLIKVPAAPDRK